MTDTPTARRLAALTEAYHTAFDIKDEAKDAGQRDGLFYACYEATNHLADLIARLGGTPPNRFDGDGRPPEADDQPLPLVLVIENPEEDPTIVSSNSVEIWEESSYPSTKFAYSDRKDGQYDDYPGGCRQMADEADRRGEHAIAEALRDLARSFEETVEADPK